MRKRSSIIVIVVGLVAVTIASVVSMYPSLSDARDTVEAEWSTAEQALEARYDALAELSRAVRAVQADLELLDEVDDALGDWKAAASQRPTPDPDNEPPVANRVEGAAARLARTVTSRPSLRGNGDVVLALLGYLGTDPTAALQPYNDAVQRFDRARNRFPGPFFAEILGFDALSTIEVPGALAELDLPDPPTPEPPPTESDAEATTPTPAG